MRRASQRATRGQISRTVSIPAPVGGWNARDSLADMDKRDAVTLDNFFCTPNDVRVRNGYTKHATGLPAPINTLMSYSPLNGTQELFAASGTAIYNVTAAGAVGAAVLSGLTNDKIQHCMMGTAGGQFLVICNGADSVRNWDGTVWTTPAITVATSSTFIHCNVHKARLWFVEKDTLKAWYLPTDSIAGAASPFNFAGLFTRGGYLMAMATWSLDVGNGMDDYAVFITSEGQIAVYQGTDPASANTWALVGVYQLGTPIGRRCFVKYGGDVFFICREGLTPLSRALMTPGETTNQRATEKIQTVVSEYTSLYSAFYGWQCVLYPAQNMLLLNVPTAAAGPAGEQLAMNTVTGAWSRFTGWNAACWERHNDAIYFGGEDYVGLAWNTYADDGANIEFEGLQSFSAHGGRAQLHHVKMVRPIISTSGQPSIRLGVNADFDTSQPTGVLSYTAAPGAVWDAAVWDTDLWGGNEGEIKRSWQTAFALGYSFAAHLDGSVRLENLRWISTDYVLEDAGVI